MTTTKTPNTPSAAASAADDESFQPVAALLGLVLPGLGHWYLRERGRAVRVFAGVMGLFLTGVLVGGVDVVDRQEDPVWFLGQALVGPTAFGVNWVNQSVLKGHPLDAAGKLVVDDRGAPAPRRTAYPDETVERRSFRTGNGGSIELPVLVPNEGAGPPGTKSLGRVNELGTLFCTVAGMLNLIAVFDASFRRRREAAGGAA